MSRINRRAFFGAGAAAAGSLVGQAALGDQGEIAASRPLPTDDDTGNPLGLVAGTGVTADDVRRAIEAGARYLKSRQFDDGSWPDQPHYDGGLTPLATLALLHAGCSPHDTSLDKALQLLRKTAPRSTYATSLQTMVFCLAEPERDMPLVIRNTKWLEERQWKNGEQIGMWSISPRGSTDHADNSMTHFAMLALYEAERLGFRVRPSVWQLALDHWRNTQNDDGSWGWGPKYPGSGSMTCAGIAAITIATGRLDSADASVRDDQIVGCGLQQTDPSLQRAFDWLIRHFSVARNPGTEFWHSYYLYALERAGRMTGQRFFGTHDWYREGARTLVSTQSFSGAWPPDVEFQKVEDANVSTCFSLVFLAKGRWPVVMAHLAHHPENDWNRHRSALSNLVSHVEKSWQRNLTHQVVNLEHASVEDLLESPVLFLNGRNAPQLSVGSIKKLRMYVDRGGFIFAECCCGGPGFDAGFRSVVAKLFPEQEFSLQPLPPDHSVWFADGPIEAEFVPQLWGVDVSCRTAVIYCPTDLSASWELDRLGRENDYSERIRARLHAARQLGINVLTYATGREVEFKNPTLPLAAASLPENNAASRGQLLVANVLHPGGCRAAPGAVRKLLQHAADSYGVEVGREPSEVSLSSNEIYKYHVLFMHGRSKFELTPQERAQLRAYLERGGMLIADAICSSSAFGHSFQHEMATIFPQSKLETIPDDDPILTPAFGGGDITRVTRRDLKSVLRGSPTTLTTRPSPPKLEAIRLGDRYAVVFSPLDISCALELEPVGCAGYIRRDALQIAMNLLLYALNQ